MVGAGEYGAVPRTEPAGNGWVRQRVRSMFHLFHHVKHRRPVTHDRVAPEPLTCYAVIFEPDELGLYVLEKWVMYKQQLRHEHQLPAVFEDFTRLPVTCQANGTV